MSDAGEELAAAPIVESLRPCPLCGSEDIHIMGVAGWQVLCASCGCKRWPVETKEKAVAAWNVRSCRGYDFFMKTLIDDEVTIRVYVDGVDGNTATLLVRHSGQRV